MKIDSCLCCGGGSLTTILDWGLMSLANNYNIKEKYPIRLNKCNSCFHLQLDEYVEPEILFKNYPYFSGTSKTSLDYFSEFASMALRYYPEAKTVLDIACNDGAQLDAFKSLGLTTYGIDPAENMLNVSTRKGHKIVCGMFPNEPKIYELKYDIIVSQNVVAHVPNPLEFMKGCSMIMKYNSYLFVATSQANMVIGTEFDTIYHEHISYFNTVSMRELVERAGLVLEDVFTNPIHGTSYIFVIKKHKTTDPVQDRIKFEDGLGLYKNETYYKWVNDCKIKAEETKSIIEDFKSKGYTIIGCGAAAKGITFLNLSKIILDKIVDTTPSKWFVEVCDTTIMPFEYLRTIDSSERVLFVVLAWNFYKEIKENVLRFRNNPNDVFITTNHE